MVDTAIGVGIGLFHRGLPDPKQLFQYVERADQLGIDSIWTPDHVISENPELDPSVLMSVIAARTADIKMGPSVMTLPARNPVEVANTYASLDYLTGGRGRVILGVGLGADPRLCEAINVPADQRAGRLQEAIEILRLLWTEDNVSYDGTHYQLDSVTVNPKPNNGPLDIWIGGNSDAALKRIAQYGDGWFPSLITPETFEKKLRRLMKHCDRVGREVERDEAGVILLSHIDTDPSRAQHVRNEYYRQQAGDVPEDVFHRCTAFGTPDDVVDTIERYIEAGCTKFVLLPVGPNSERIKQLERYSQSVIPEVS